ncbi:MAG: hypothetical protein J6K97_00860 [Clostridia bacterium]|nr:hypothetical protein [Clostridia bacterium]
MWVQIPSLAPKKEAAAIPLKRKTGTLKIARFLGKRRMRAKKKRSESEFWQSVAFDDDAQASDACGGNTVWVQIPSLAPNKRSGCTTSLKILQFSGNPDSAKMENGGSKKVQLYLIAMAILP